MIKYQKYQPLLPEELRLELERRYGSLWKVDMFPSVQTALTEATKINWRIIDFGDKDIVHIEARIDTYNSRLCLLEHTKPHHFVWIKETEFPF